MSLGERIKSACAAAGFAQAELTRRISIKPQQLNEIFRSKTGKSKHLSAIASALNVDVRWLTTGDPSRAPSWARPPAPIPGIPEHQQAEARQVLRQVDIDHDQLAGLLATKLAKLTTTIPAAQAAADQAELRLLQAENAALRQQLRAAGIVPVELDRETRRQALIPDDDPDRDLASLEEVRAALIAKLPDEHQDASAASSKKP